VTTRALILHLGRSGAMGEQRRVASWTEMFNATGSEVVTVSLLAQHPAPRVLPRPADLRRVWEGRVVPEVLAWSPRSVRALLERVHPRLVVCVSARAYHPALAGCAGVTVLDFVDSLARSYGDRGVLSRGWRRRGFAALSTAHRRFEAGPPLPRVRRVAAGWRDAADLGAEWVPILAPALARVPAGAARFDLAFFGNLCYPPNVAAVRRLSRLWPALQRRRPGTSALIAGATPSPEVWRLAARHGWELIPDFTDLRATCALARLAVAPLDHTAGIQIKVLEAAALGIAQVVTPEALEGMAPGFPATVAPDDGSLIEGVCRLLDDSALRTARADAAWTHVRDEYSIERWRHWALSAISETAA
jgi:hypothetical protein